MDDKSRNSSSEYASGGPPGGASPSGSKKIKKWKPRTVAMYKGERNCQIGEGTYGFDKTPKKARKNQRKTKKQKQRKKT